MWLPSRAATMLYHHGTPKQYSITEAEYSNGRQHQDAAGKGQRKTGTLKTHTGVARRLNRMYSMGRSL
jgi:hypothetical protein